MTTKNFFWLGLILILAILAGILIHKNFILPISRTQINLLAEQNAALETQIMIREIKIDSLQNLIINSKLEMDSIDERLKEQESKTNEIARKYNQLQSDYEAGEIPDLTPDQVFEWCNDVLDEKDKTIISLQARNIKSDEIITTLEQVIQGKDKIIEDIRIQLRNEQEGKQIAIAGWKESERKNKRKSAEMWGWRGIAAVGLIYLIVK